MRMIDDLKQMIHQHPHHILDSAEAASEIDHKEWCGNGKPCMWVKVDTIRHDGDVYRAWFDHGHGIKVMTKGDDNEVVGITTSLMIVCGEVVLIDFESRYHKHLQLYVRPLGAVID